MQKLKTLLYVLVAIVILCGVAYYFLAKIGGFGAWDRRVATLTGYSRICVGGVEYLQFTSGASVAYNPDGTVKRCK